MVPATAFADSEQDAISALQPLRECPVAEPIAASGAERMDFPSLFDLSGSMWPEGQRSQVDAMYFDTSSRRGPTPPPTGSDSPSCAASTTRTACSSPTPRGWTSRLRQRPDLRRHEPEDDRRQGEEGDRCGRADRVEAGGGAGPGAGGG